YHDRARCLYGFLTAPADSLQLVYATQPSACCTQVVVTLYGVVALSFMMTMYALEGRDDRYILGFALGCLLSSSYGFLSGAWPFGVVEAVWCVIALNRYRVAAAQP